ncbi:MAG: HmuY family protein, partial [Myxococcota bacterium]
MSTRVLVLAAMSLALGSGCAEEIGSSTNDTPSSNSTASNSTAEGLISHTDMGDGTFVTQVHAVDEAAWVYLNLEDRAEVTVSDPFTSLDWDLGFQRFRIKTNGGISGSGGMGVAV